MGALVVLTPVLVGAALLALLLSIVSGLLRVCEWLEEHPTQGGSIGRRIGLLTAAVVAATTFTDDLPWLYLLTGLAAAFVLPGTSGKTSRSDLAHASASGTGLSGIVVSLQCFASFLAHLVLWHHFHMTASKTVAWHELRTGPQSELLRLRPEQRDRPLLPGGRIDWDIHADDMDAGAAPSSSSALHRPPFATHSSAQQLAAIIVCWLPALWAILCAIAQSGSLPLTNTTTQRQRARGSALTHKADWGR